jgi:hypothetical protein
MIYRIEICKWMLTRGVLSTVPTAPDKCQMCTMQGLCRGKAKHWCRFEFITTVLKLILHTRTLKRMECESISHETQRPAYTLLEVLKNYVVYIQYTFLVFSRASSATQQRSCSHMPQKWSQAVGKTNRKGPSWCSDWWNMGKSDVCWH